jgi:glutamyl-tRNA synthetase
MKETVRTRFAPSPTGFLHIGGARTALFNYLFAKKNKGDFVLRVDDTDMERSKEEYEKDILASLKWLGIKWDEMYKQSERRDIYKKYLKKLIEEKRAYYCFCSEEELEEEKKEQTSRGLAPKYNGKCSSLSEKEVEENLRKGKKSIIRLRVPVKNIKFNDLIRGEIVFDSSLLGDFPIAKNIESPLYNFASVVDDEEIKITHVIRAEEHLSNTPRQILIQEALGFKKPIYGHISLILAEDKTKLSKREGAVSVLEFKKEGYLPEAMVNFMAFLGWNPGDEREIFSIEDLIKEFSIEKVHKSGAVFDEVKLDFINGSYIRQKPLTELAEMCVPYLAEAGLVGENTQGIKIEKIISLYKDRIKKLSEISDMVSYFFQEKINYPRELLDWKGVGEAETKKTLEILEKIISEVEEKKWNAKVLGDTLLLKSQERAEELGKSKDKGYLLWPLRAALTGQKFSAGPFDVAEILGKEKTLQRIAEAKNLFI